MSIGVILTPWTNMTRTPLISSALLTEKVAKLYPLMNLDIVQKYKFLMCFIQNKQRFKITYVMTKSNVLFLRVVGPKFRTDKRSPHFRGLEDKLFNKS